MWQISKPKDVKLVMGILAADAESMELTIEMLRHQFGAMDFISPLWQFKHTEYYKTQAGADIVKQYISFEQLIDPGKLAEIKHKTNEIEMQLAEQLQPRLGDLPRPVNIDPGTMETSKLILASTKNFSHRIYIGQNMYAEVTLSYIKGKWVSYPYTFPDHKDDRYHDFLSKVRQKLASQLKQQK